MNDEIPPADLLTLLSGNLPTTPETLPEATASLTLDDVRRWVAGQIAHLLNRNPALLMSALYRIDVPERSVKQAFAQAPPESLPDVLADLAIQRQLEKLRYRRRYRSPED